MSPDSAGRLPASEGRLPMEKRSLGDSGLPVTPFGLGLAALGRPGYINLGHASDLQADYAVDAMESRAHAVLDAAWRAGIRYFDAARSYGRAEAFLGSWLTARGIRPADVAVGSKWGYTYTAGWQVTAEAHEVKEHSVAVLRRQIQESRGQLGAHIDLYQIHSATLESGVLDNTLVLDALARLKADGLAIGLSLSGPAQAATLARALTVFVDGVRLFDAVQATWNVLERSAADALAEAHSAGLGIIVKEALANGRLTARNASKSFQGAMSLLRRVAGEHGVTVDALALAAALAQPWATVVLSGAAQPDHLQSNVGALALAWTDALEAALAPLQEPPEQYWRVRSQLAWN